MIGADVVNPGHRTTLVFFVSSAQPGETVRLVGVCLRCRTRSPLNEYMGVISPPSPDQRLEIRVL